MSLRMDAGVRGERHFVRVGALVEGVQRGDHNKGPGAEYAGSEDAARDSLLEAQRVAELRQITDAEGK